MFRDITRKRQDRRAIERRYRVFVELAAATQPLSDPASITGTAARILAEHLGADRCAYAEVEDESVYIITGDYTRGVPSIVGRWPIGAFGEEHLRIMRANEAYVVDDVATDPRIAPGDRAAYEATTIHAVISVPLHKGGRLTAAMAVHSRVSRTWTPDEIELVNAVAAQCWEALERARVDRALRASEERFRSLFEAMDEGFCLVEPLFDASGKPFDYRYLLTNPALEKHTGLRNVVGKTAREVMPNHESHWVEAYGRVALTGETFRDEGRVEDLDRWYEVAAFRVGLPEARQVGVLFGDVSARHRAQETIRASEQQLADIFRLAPSFMAVLRGPDHTFERVNDRYHQLVSGRPLIGRTIRDALPEVVAQGFLDLLDRVYQSGVPYVGEGTRVLLDPGGDRPVQERILDFVYQPLRDPAGAITGVLVHGIDLTERKQAEEAARERDERLQLLLGTASDYAVVMSDLEGRVVEWLGGAAAITGYTPAEAVGQGIELLFTTEDRAAGMHEKEMATAARAGKAEDKRWHRKKNGDLFFADGVMVSLRGEQGELRGFGKVFRDVTARKRADDSVQFLADASASLGELVDHVSTLRRIATLAVGRFADWCLVDVPGEEGRRPRFVVVHEAADEPRAPCVVNEAAWEDEPSGGSPSWPWSEGGVVIPDLGTAEASLDPREERWRGTLRECGVLSTLRVPFLARGRAVGGLMFFARSGRRRFGAEELRVAQDLAERVTATLETSRLYRNLQEQDRRKDEFLATLAHELRNPLAPLRNGIQILQTTLPGDEQASQTLRMMDRQLGHMVHLVDDLLDVARLSRGKVALRKERIELRAVVDAAIETTRQAIEGAGHHLEVDLPRDAVELDADRTRLVQILANLLSNAAKYTPRGGHIRIQASIDQGFATLEVVDDGIGMPCEMLPKVFDMFTQIGTSLERSQGGLGIGLTLVRRLVEMHGGSVEAESAGPGCGSLFRVRLPVMEPGRRPEALEGEVPAQTAPFRVLVVDDNADAADSLAMLLGLGGYEVKTARDGPDALRMLETFRARLVLLDIGLPGMSGYEVARRIRESPELRRVTLAALTGWGQEEDRRRSREAGFDYHLTKPVDPQDLDRLLSEVAARDEEPQGLRAQQQLRDVPEGSSEG